MTRQLEVVYEAGVLRPLEPLPFAEKQHLVVTVTDELHPKATFSSREQEQEWLHVNSPRHAGKWLAIEGDQLVGEGDNAKAVLEQARANGIAHPLLVQIPNDPQLPFAGGRRLIFRIDFDRSHSYTGRDDCIALPVVLQVGEQRVDFVASLDTGASHKLFC